jgi:hypothetical protein
MKIVAKMKAIKARQLQFFTLSFYSAISQRPAMATLTVIIAILSLANFIDGASFGKFLRMENCSISGKTIELDRCEIRDGKFSFRARIIKPIRQLNVRVFLGSFNFLLFFNYILIIFSKSFDIIEIILN